MGVLIVILIIIVIVVTMNKSKKDTSNSRTARSLLGIDLSQVPNYGPLQVMYLLGCLSYYDCILRNDIFLMAGLPDKDALEGVFISINVDSLQHTLHFVPEDLLTAVNEARWVERTDDKLEISFPMLDRKDFLNQRKEYLDSFVAGVQGAQRCSGNFLDVDNPRDLFVVIPNPNNEHMLFIDNKGPSGGPYDNMYKKIF